MGCPWSQHRCASVCICTGPNHPAPIISVTWNGAGLLEQMLPLHKLAFTPYINFMAGVLLLPAWCSALCFIPRGMNGSGFNLPNGGKLMQLGAPEWHMQRPKRMLLHCLLPDTACSHWYFWASKMKDKKKWGSEEGVPLSPFLSCQSIHLWLCQQYSVQPLSITPLRFWIPLSALWKRIGYFSANLARNLTSYRL